MTTNGTHLNAENSVYIESLYEQFLSDPGALPNFWREYFEGLGPRPAPEVAHTAVRAALVDRARLPARPAAAGKGVDAVHAEKQAAVLRLIHSYRLLGHLLAETDPIHLRALPKVPDLELSTHGLTEADLDTVFSAGTLEGVGKAPLREILAVVKTIYCGHVSSEFLHIIDYTAKKWLQQRLESSRCQPRFEPLFKRYLLEQLTAAEGIEQFLHTKYTGQKRFSLEGGESLIPMLDALIQRAGTSGVKEVAIGMAHRGRLNVLTNIMGKAPRDLFQEFEGKADPGDLTSGDVKYHQGFATNLQTPGGPVHVALAFNPSHLEIIDPVLLGSVRARQDRQNDLERNRVLGVLIHGDAALAGQGVVYETLNLSQTRGFSTGGTIHIVVNNRIGFTLSNPRDIHSTIYCTDVGKVVQAPIFHVNGDDPEAVVFTIQLAMDYRMTFHRDVMIDLICFRRHGHNEADEPSATQPMMYGKIGKNPGVRRVYADRLIREGVVTEEDTADMTKVYRSELEAGQPVSENRLSGEKYTLVADWTRYRNASWTAPGETRLSLEDIRRLGQRITAVPETLELHPRVAKIMAERAKMVVGGLPMDWGCAETLAYASLLEQGYAVRLSGQDSGRGTFFHRHAVLHNQRNGEAYIPLEHISEKQGRVTIIDSILSEEAVLGFELGYAASEPEALIIWEAQFGDFVNGAQVVIDQFISSSEQKWRLICGLVLMLPHGWEGQGPEHTSARLERFLQLCAQENMQVCNPSTPAQMFHLLRRQVLRPYRKPLIIMSPKSTLRRKISFSNLEELSRGGFQTVIGEVDPIEPRDVRRVVLCSGKVYYDVLEARRERGEQKIAVVRLEQLYPFPDAALKKELGKYPNASEVVWTQEEPMNQGAWEPINGWLRECLRKDQSLYYAGRLPSAAPSGGYYQKHLARQTRLIHAALNLEWTGDHPIIIYQSNSEPVTAARS